MCCPFRSIGNARKPHYLTKQEACTIVCEERITQGKNVRATNYDPVVREELERREMIGPVQHEENSDTEEARRVVGEALEEYEKVCGTEALFEASESDLAGSGACDS